MARRTNVSPNGYLMFTGRGAGIASRRAKGAWRSWLITLSGFVSFTLPQEYRGKRIRIKIEEVTDIGSL